MDMGPAAILLGVAFPVLIGIGVALAVADSNEIEFWVARACFMLAAFDAVGFTVYWLWAAEKVPNWKLITGALIGAVAILSLVYGLKWIDYREDRVIARLFPGNKATPAVPDCRIPDSAVAVFFGSNVAWSTRFPYTILNIGGVEMLSLGKVANSSELEINILRIFDDHGNIIARIDPDEFWIDPSLRRKKPDRSTLIVYDRSDQEVLRVEFLNPKALIVQGIFRDRRGVTVQITPDALILPRNNTLRRSCFGEVGTAIMVR